MMEQRNTGGRRSWLAGLLLILTGWSGFGFLREDGKETNPEARQWLEDVQYLMDELPARHVSLQSLIPLDEFRRRARQLQERIPGLSREEFLTGLMQLAAAANDSHTAVGYRPEAAFPLMLYWFQYLPEDKTIYLKYNSCREMSGRPFGDATDELLRLAGEKQVEKLVIDLRHNGGGNSGIMDPFIDRLASWPALNQRGRLFVITGRQTFSSAILNAVALKKKTAALFAGEPTGGKPDHYGEVQMLELPRTKLSASYSTKYFRVTGDGRPSFLPDFTIEPSAADYLANRDPVLDAILQGRVK